MIGALFVLAVFILVWGGEVLADIQWRLLCRDFRRNPLVLDAP